MTSYVDDVNLASQSLEELLRAITCVRQYEADFSLSLSIAKTKIWSSNPIHSQELEETTGFGATRVLDALGGQWCVTKCAVATYPREHARLDECIHRLHRARSMPVSLPRLAQFISVGCLSLLDYVNLLDPKPYAAVRTLVKHALNQKSGAPEIVTGILTQGTIDPQLR